MGFRHITATVLLIIHLYPALGEDLPMLPGNKLLIGRARELSNANSLDCRQGGISTNEFTTSITAKPGMVLNEFFSQHPFTSFTKKSAGSCDKTPISRYTFAKMVHCSRTIYALQLDTGSQAEKAYWLPRGGTIDIPKNPAADTKYVFTHDLNQHSVLTVTPMNNDMLRLRHIEDGNEGPGFNALNEAEKGGPVTYALQFKDYGYIRKEEYQMIRHETAFAYMAFSENQWSVNVQHQTCPPKPIYYYYDKNNKLERLMMEHHGKSHAVIPSVASFSIPSGSETLFTLPVNVNAAAIMSSTGKDSGSSVNLVSEAVRSSEMEDSDSDSDSGDPPSQQFCSKDSEELTTEGKRC